MCTHPCDRKSQGEREGEEVKARRERERLKSKCTVASSSGLSEKQAVVVMR